MALPDRPTILIADDEPSIRTLLRYILAREHFRVLEAEDGERALELARAERPDVMVLDVMMPRQNGFEVCRLLRAEPATAALPILLLTAKDTPTDRARAEEAGASEYFCKTCDKDVLVAAIRRYLPAARQVRP
jgi:DNA-binding response OmpR family regulator